VVEHIGADEPARGPGRDDRGRRAEPEPDRLAVDELIRCPALRRASGEAR
jgi:hypothetical protein